MKGPLAMSSHTDLEAKTKTATLALDFHLDLICPWCWIGLRHLRAALKELHAQQPNVVWQIRWHAQTLQPQIPEQGLDYQAFYIARLGSAEAVAARRAQVQAAAQPAGLMLNFDSITVFPNTRKICALVNAAQMQLASEAMLDFVESVFAAYFQQGCDLGDVQVLLQLARDGGLNLQSDVLTQPVPAASMGVASGVPHFVFNHACSETGAVSVACLLQRMLVVGAAHD
ncbi:DsbA family protein [Comamonas resistens]|uniref:DsbA family protein n=1 Tax=Comamonas resistens TaxID=3046670 RepID=UPI0039BD5A1F